MELFWTEPARAHLSAIHAELSETSIAYADRVVERLMNRARQLAEFPRSGAIVPRAAALELRVLVERPYRIFYVVGPGHVDILAVLHGRRDIL